MYKQLLNPEETMDVISDKSIHKTKLTLKQKLIQGILAGAFIAFGGQGYVMSTALGMPKLIGAAIFPIGLILIVMLGAELFTGNNLMTIGLIQKKITAKSYIKSLSVVYICNLAGALIIAFMIDMSSLNGDFVGLTAKSIALSKVSITFTEAFIRGILCNIIVVLAVWMAFSADGLVAKSLASWIPVTFFVFVGFEHSIANMFFIPLGILSGAKISIYEAFLNNILPVTLGNFFGGGIIIPYLYHFVYLKK